MTAPSISNVLSAASLAVLFSVAAPSAHSQSTVSWGECPPVQEGFPDIGEQQCALLSVPLDYRAPTGRSIQIAISRIKAADPAKRRGVLLLNIGGPGARGLDFPRFATALFPQNVLDTYDLIGFDPRGIGRSVPVTCGLTPEQSAQAFPQLEQEQSFDATVNFARNVAASCAGTMGNTLPFITTANTARDMDRIRAALGESKISYFAYSYGTYLGAVYASLFPARADRWVLDSAVNPDWLWRAQFRSWGPGGEARFADFAAFAIANEETLHFGSTPEEVRTLYLKLLQEADANPIDFDGFRVDGPMFRVLNFSFLYNDASFTETARLWQAVRDNAGANDAANVGASAASFPEVPPDNGEMSTGAVLCDDVAWPRSVDQYRRELAADTRRFPLFGPLGSHIWACAFWTTPPIEPPVPLTSNGPANKILILNTLRDPATPLPGAQRMRAVLGQRARLILVEGGGHGIFGLMDNVCATDAVASYLAEGIFPDADSTCSANQASATLQTERSSLRQQAITTVLRELMPMRR